MTINLSDNSPRISYSVAQGITQSTFTVPFEFFSEESLNVYVDGILKTLTTDYTATGGNGSTGSVVISVTGASGGSIVVITREIDLERTADFPTSGPFQISALNTELDRIIAIAADLNDRADRSLHAQDFDPSASYTLPALDSRKGTVLAFNATSGDVEVGPQIANVQSLANVSADIALLADIQDGTTETDAITNVNTIRTDVTTVSGISNNVTTVADISTDVTTVAGVSANVTTVAGVSSEVATLGPIASNITTVSANDSNVTIVATNIGSVNTVASNIADVIAVASDLTEAISEVETVANDLNEATSEIEVVANNISNVNTVGNISGNVTTVAGISGNVTTVANNDANVTTVANNDANITTVAGISGNVTTVANNDANVTAVAGNATDISTVAGIDTAVSTVATNNANVTTAATGITNINTVATSISDVNTTASNIGDVNTVAGEIGVSGVVTIVATAITDVSTVSGDIAAVITAANDLNEAVSEIDTVSNNIANVNAVGTNISNVNTVAGNNANITTVAGNTTNINTVAASDANVTTLAGISGDVSTLAGISSDVTAVAADATDIGTVSGAIANVNSVGGSIANVNTVATNISSVNDFADKYRVGATDPSTDNDEGDLFYNTSSDTLKVYTGSAWEQGVTAGSGFMPLSGGQFSGNITFSGTETVDGRDVSADGTKLDGIEAGATADQTDAEIRAAVEAATDSNVFTDADHTKLNGIATSANNYTHPTHPGDDINIDTGALSGATVISDLDFNITTDTLGHVTDANATVSTRNITLANLGYTGATNANYITNNNQLTNGAGYTTYTANQSVNTSSAPTFAEVYNDGWFRNSQSGEGLYNQTNQMHFASYANNAYNMYSNTTSSRLNMATSGNTVRGSFYANNSNDVGILDSDNDWVIRHVRDSRTEFYVNGTEYMQLDANGLYLNNGSLREDHDALSGTSPTCNVNNGGAFSLSMTGNTTFTFSGAVNGMSNGFVLQVTGNGSTLTWPSTVDWAGGTAPDAPASGESNLYVFYTRDGGSNWIGVLSSAAYA